MRFPEEKMERFYPGVYTPEEQAAIDRYKRGETGRMFGADGPAMPSTDLWVMQLYARCWDRWNPLFNDLSYAKNTPWGNLPAIPGYVSLETRYNVPPELGYLLRPDGEAFLGDGYDHTDEFFAPVFPGDALHSQDCGWDVIDITPPEGSVKRLMIFVCSTNVYNQEDVLVARCTRRWPERLMRSRDPEINEILASELPGAEPKKPPKSDIPDADRKAPPPMPGGVGGNSRHKAHKMTPADYDIFKDIWNNEKIRGAEPLYWEDVSIGDEPAPVASPPQVGFEILRTIAAWDIMKSTNGLQELLTGKGGDPHFYRYNPETGLYDNESGHYGLGQIAYLYNFHAKLLGTRMITNWCGDAGFVTRLGWRFVNDAPAEKQFNHFPEGFYRPTELLKVPYMKDRYCNIHGFGDDAFITRGYVYDKYVDADGGHYVDLICWCEDLDGNIGQEIPATVKLPTREG